MQQPATPSTPVNNAPSATPSAATAPAASAPAGASSTPIRINSAKQHGAAGGGDTLAHPATPHSHSMPGTPQQQPQSSSVPTGGHLLQLQAPLPSAGGGPGAVTPSGLSSMGASNQSLGVSVGAASSVSGISITPPNSAGLRQSTAHSSAACRLIRNPCPYPNPDPSSIRSSKPSIPGATLSLNTRLLFVI
ncbi:GM23105 [Drosophila sechellia]|uniref:GM23105 n=1 Tax=Drosophila sechellia TaxID=7238 RepID=B4IID9_DROSE|nr:GM23105 [Drosophila sechellia]